MKKKILTLALVVVMVAIMLTSFTLAYFTDTSAVAKNVMTVGNVAIKQTEEFAQGATLMPGAANAIKKTVTVENTGSAPVYVRTLIAIEGEDCISGKLNVEISDEVTAGWRDAKADGADKTCAQFKIGDKVFTVMECVYPEALKNGQTYTSLKSVYLDDSTTAKDLKDAGVSGDYEILVLPQAVQTEGLGEDASAALDKAFEPLTDAYAATLFGGAAY